MGRPRQYTKEFRLEAARLVVQEGYKIKEAAERLGVNHWTLRDWIRQFRQSGEVVAKPNASPAEQLKEVRAENRRLRLENEILKKAAAYFAKESL
jgi:transposase